MQTREAHLPLSGWGGDKTEATLTVALLSPGDRLKRAALAPLVGIGIVIIVIPIPIVHLIVPPLALIGGVVAGLLRAGTRELILSAHGPCPFCGTNQTLGLSSTPYRLPRTLHCRNCRKAFSIDARL